MEGFNLLKENQPSHEQHDTYVSRRIPRINQEENTIRDFQVPSVASRRRSRLASGIIRIIEDGCFNKHSTTGIFPGKTGNISWPFITDSSLRIFYSPGRFSKIQTLILFMVKKSSLVKRLEVSESVFILAIIYMQRLISNVRHFDLTDYNVHRIFITAVLLGTKFQEDEEPSNYLFVNDRLVASAETMKALELEFLRRIDFNLFVDVHEYEKMEKAVFDR